MALAYVPPGVTIQELTSPSITPLLALPGSVCLVGMSQGYIQRTDLIQLNSTTPTVLPSVPAGATMTSSSIVSIMDALNPGVAPSGFNVSTDYTFNPTTYAVTRVVTSNTLSGQALSQQNVITLSSGAVPAVGQVVNIGGATPELGTVQSVSGQTVTLVSNLAYTHASSATVTWGNIPDGDSVFVTYTYVPADYWLPIRLNSMADIQARFGNAWDPTGTTVNSPLSFAAQIAFENGASNIVLQPLFYNAGTPALPVLQQPTNQQAASSATWQSVYNSLLGLQDINIIVPVIGQSAPNVNDAIQLQILEATQDFVYAMLQSNGIYVVAVLGEDSTASTPGSPEGQDATIQSHAQTLASRYGNAVSQQTVLINTANFARANSVGTFSVGGQYVAAAIAGMLASRQPSDTLTRQAVAGFTSVADNRTKAQKNADAGYGLMVVESQGNVVQIRHSVTLDTTSVVTREVNVVRGKHYVVSSVQDTLDTQVIAKVVADADAPTLVNNVVIGILEELRGLGALSDYANVASRITSINPTAMEVRFSFQPVLYVNYITIVFSLDLTSGTVDLLTDSSGSTASSAAVS